MFSKLICTEGKVLSIYCRQIYTSSIYSQNHYEILNLKSDCSQADIRNAYLKLSKQFHPDKNQDANTHKKFVNIVEAYNVLSRPFSRHNYDLGLMHYNNNSNVHVRTRNPGVWTDDTFWEHRDTSQDAYYVRRPYYGIKGLKKISNFWIVLLCIGFTSIGVLLQIIAIRQSFTLRRDNMEKRSLQLEQLHSEIRARALENGDKKQIELLIQKLNNKNN